MAWTFKQGTSAYNATLPITTAAFGGSVTNGNLLVVAVTDQTGGTDVIDTLTDTGGNTYYFADTLININDTTQIYYAYGVTGGASFTVTADASGGGAGTRYAIVVQEFQPTNAFSGDPLDKKHQAFGLGTTANSGSTTTLSQAAELVVGIADHESTPVAAFNLGTGYSNLTQQNVAYVATAMESKVVSATTAVTATFGIALSRRWACEVVTFKDPPAATTVKQLAAMGVG